jgi:hypothetical protein
VAPWRTAIPCSSRKPRPDLVDHRRALADEPAAHAVQGLQFELLAALERDKPHGGPLHGLGDRFGIAIIVLVAFQERLT